LFDNGYFNLISDYWEAGALGFEWFLANIPPPPNGCPVALLLRDVLLGDPRNADMCVLVDLYAIGEAKWFEAFSDFMEECSLKGVKDPDPVCKTGKSSKRHGKSSEGCGVATTSCHQSRLYMILNRYPKYSTVLLKACFDRRQKAFVPVFSLKSLSGLGTYYYLLAIMWLAKTPPNQFEICTISNLSSTKMTESWN
jgi:hypothetical protein